jgi:hypothetical protein
MNIQVVASTPPKRRVVKTGRKQIKKKIIDDGREESPLTLTSSGNTKEVP